MVPLQCRVYNRDADFYSRFRDATAAKKRTKKRRQNGGAFQLAIPSRGKLPAAN
jgi:hypothetical protein